VNWIGGCKLSTIAVIQIQACELCRNNKMLTAAVHNVRKVEKIVVGREVLEQVAYCEPMRALFGEDSTSLEVKGNGGLPLKIVASARGRAVDFWCFEEGENTYRFALSCECEHHRGKMGKPMYVSYDPSSSTAFVMSWEVFAAYPGTFEAIIIPMETAFDSLKVRGDSGLTPFIIWAMVAIKLGVEKKAEDEAAGKRAHLLKILN